MVDITHKKNTLRIATAEALLKVSKIATIEAIKNNKVPKGDVFEMSRAAGLLGVKKTPELLPDCHPLPIEFAGFEFAINGLEIKISCTLKTIYKTGVEVEAIKINSAVIVCSDSISRGEKEDGAGKQVIKALENWNVKVDDYTVIPDDIDQIQAQLKSFTAANTSLILFIGGTGLSPRDQTPEAISPFLEKRIPGMEEAIRKYGQDRTSYAALSRSLVGMKGDSLIMALPGSTKGAVESLHAIFPEALHLFDIIKGAQHKA